MNITIVCCFDTYEHRVELLRKVFRESGHTVSVVMSQFRHFHKTFRETAPEGYYLVPVKPYYKNMSVARLDSHRRFAASALMQVRELKPDLLWVLAPPNSLVKEAARYKRECPDVKLVLDIIDMWPETMPISRFKSVPPFSFWKALRDKYVDEADVIVTECALYQEILRKRCDARKLKTLYLAREAAPFHGDWNPPENRIALCYLGSINSLIDIPRIGEIIRGIDAPVELHIIGDGERRDELLETARASGAEVFFHGKVYDPEEKQKIFDRCHAGLNVMKDSVYVGLTMKSIDYFEASLPIINTIKGDTWSFVGQSQIGINYAGDTMLSAEMLRSIQASRAQVREFFEGHFTETIFANCAKKILIESERQI